MTRQRELRGAWGEGPWRTIGVTRGVCMTAASAVRLPGETGRADAAPMSEHSFLYESCDIPAGLTIRDWRTARATERAPRRRIRHLLHLH